MKTILRFLAKAFWEVVMQIMEPEEFKTALKEAAITVIKERFDSKELQREFRDFRDLVVDLFK